MLNPLVKPESKENIKRWKAQKKMTEQRSNIGVVSIKANGSSFSIKRQNRWGQNPKPEYVLSTIYTPKIK